MKISVLGAGAVGCMIAGLIRSNDPSVEIWLHTRGKHATVMQNRGLVQLRGECGAHDVPVHVCRDISDIANSELILLTVKSAATDQLLSAAVPHIGDARVVSLQNGLNQHVLSRWLDDSQFLVGITTTNMSVVQPGIVEMHHIGPTLLGRSVDSTAQQSNRVQERDRQVLAILARSGLPMIGHHPIEQVQYNKIASNALGYTSALSQSNYAIDCLLDQQWRETIAIPLLRESTRVVAAAGIEMARVPSPSDALRLQQALWLLKFPIIRCPIARLIRRRGTPRLVYSVEQDLLRGRPTEMRFVNGEIVRLAQQVGTPAPLHQLSLELVEELEAAQSPRFFTKREVIDRFAQLQLNSTSFGSHR